MKIAIAVWEGRISPVFDVARLLWLVEVDSQGIEIRRETKLFPKEDAVERVTYLRDQGVEVLICGAISTPLAEMIQAQGIRLVPFICGDANTVFDAFLRGNLPSPPFLLPGRCGRRRRWRGGWGGAIGRCIL